MKYPRIGISRALIVCATTGAFSGCTLLSPWVPYGEPPLVAPPLRPAESAANMGTNGASNSADASNGRTTITPMPAPPVDRVEAGQPRAAKPSALPDQPADLAVNFEQVPLSTFLQVVFGSMLKLRYSVDPQVAARQDLVTIRTGKPQTPGELFETARLLLKSYGIAVQDINGFYRIVPDGSAAGYAPEIRRGRALPEVPGPLRPVFQLVELQAVRVAEVSQWLRTLFGTRITITDDLSRNAILMSGQSDTVAAALEAIQVLDQPLMRGRTSVRITPAFWSADELARRLAEVMRAQGYSVGNNPSGNEPVIILPVTPINAVLVFAVSRDILGYVGKWASELDKPASGGGGYFTYTARYSDAQELAKTMQELISGSTQAAPAAGGQAGQAGTPRRPTRVVVNAATNSLIFQGNADEYTQWLGLLQELDRPARTVLIEATVAEVRLLNNESLGVEWAFSAGLGGGSLDGGSLGGLGVGKDGLTINFINGAGKLRAVINALASDSRARILSSPRLVTRNGESAMIQVGSEVPVITSQQSNANTGANTGGVLQTISYRQTGVILKVRPIIHAGGRVELDVAQEVSAAQQTQTGVNSSPTFLTRKVETKLSLSDGATVLLGGLIQQNDSKANTGIPLLKDIPVLGQAFRNNTNTGERTELIVLITPYVISNDYEASVITEAFRSRLGGWAGAPLPPPERPTPSPIAPTVSSVSGDAVAPNPSQSAPDAPAVVSVPGDRIAPGMAAHEVQGVRGDRAGSDTSTEEMRALDTATLPSPAGLGKQVTDPKLLEEIQRAINTAKKPAKEVSK